MGRKCGIMSSVATFNQVQHTVVGDDCIITLKSIYNLDIIGFRKGTQIALVLNILVLLNFNCPNVFLFVLFFAY